MVAVDIDVVAISAVLIDDEDAEMLFVIVPVVDPGTQLMVGIVPLKTDPSSHFVQEALATELHSVQFCAMQHGRPSFGSQNPITVGQY